MAKQTCGVRTSKPLKRLTQNLAWIKLRQRHHPQAKNDTDRPSHPMGKWMKVTRASFFVIPILPKGTLLGIILQHTQTCPRSIFSTLFARGKSATLSLATSVRIHVYSPLCHLNLHARKPISIPFAHRYLSVLVIDRSHRKN